MASFEMPNVEGLTSIDELKNAVGKMSKELSWLLNHLDTRNMNYIDGDVLVEGTVTANKLLVQELSAITANLGHIISGLIESVEIYGSYISTNRTGYPKAEMSNTNDMIGAYKSSDNAVQIYSPSEKLSPVVKFVTGGVESYIFYDPDDNTLSVTSNVANINLSTQGRIELFSGQGVYVQGWSFLKHNGTGHSLEDDFVMK